MPEGAPERCPLCIVQHGLTGHMEENHIVAVAAALREVGVATLRVELYGHGKSGGSFAKHTLLKWISNALAVIDYARDLPYVSDLYLCGHSQGGLLTMLVGAMEQDRLRAILPLSPAWMIPEIARKGELLGIPFDPVEIPAQLDAGDGLFLGENYIRTAQVIEVEPSILRFKKPVLLVHGSADLSVPVHYSEKAAALYPDARLVIVPGDTHCYDYHLEQMTEAVRDWFLRHM
jgi:pimeloyl-ACP methyl ester carboxylesterase